jgi:hypothetical protein
MFLLPLHLPVGSFHILAIVNNFMHSHLIFILPFEAVNLVALVLEISAEAISTLTRWSNPRANKMKARI